ncbi:hypothetical protein INN71_08750 [Nocardioides sp. ChNu-153]|uniref:hypothetical protein n=1 Tax=Nocardioides sp. ChNu-153 TaxID=2779364 RepID=UPI002653F57C|nr:hypothetical protein [Nocardioides sp. ChNu-153]MDN7121477.1 hypothetical protein [Nocardioides sp. ChNu-153]
MDVVFPESDSPTPAYLDFEDDVVEGLADRMGLAQDEVTGALAQAVAQTLAREGTPSTLFARHMRRTRAWVAGGREGCPPFLALLAVFCLAAEQMAAGDGMSQANYFGRLQAALGRPGDERVNQAYRRVAERLWSEHNRWLVELDGARGLPTAFALTHRYVGLTVSQALVRSGDRERLKEFFRQYGFAPGVDVAPSELKPVLGEWITQASSPVTSTLKRLWGMGAAKERIAQAASVALSAWDGSVQERRGRGEGGHVQRGHLALTLELGGFPRKRFAVQALLYLPQPGVPREGRVLTAAAPTAIELVPDLPGSLGLGRGSSLHAGDVLEGRLCIEDTLSGQVVERRPRRLVLFREDELSRRWVESPQVMLGDDVRLLVHQDLVGRVSAVLEAVARPGWKVLDPYPDQPAGWVVFTDVEVFGRPGDLVASGRVDDLSPLVPLTTNQLKVAGGFALPGQVRGKWHSWAPPEIRAASDAPGGFRVTVTDLRRFSADGDGDAVEETLLESWSDDGAGVLVRSMVDLDLEDGDYRVELVAGGSAEPVSSTLVLLRSADTPDHRQWAALKPVSYSDGVGTLGVARTRPGPVDVKGHVVTGGRPLRAEGDPPPVVPGWELGRRSSARSQEAVVRLTMPDADSCIHTGRHREHIETVPTDSRGRPLRAWSEGRCGGCGLVRRYPTRLPRNGAAGKVPEPDVSMPRRDVTVLPGSVESSGMWATAFDALLHTGGGSWSHLERIALQIEATALFVDQFTRTLEVLGHIDVERHPATLEPVAWEVTPTSLAGTRQGFLFSGYWPGRIYVDVGSRLEAAGLRLAVEEADDDIASYFVEATAEQVAFLAADDDGVPVVVDAWREVAGVLPPLSQLVEALPRQSAASVVGDLTWYDPRDNTWAKVGSLDAPGAYRARRFATTDVVRTEGDVANGLVARSSVQLGKHVAALMAGAPLMAFDPTSETLWVPMGADLPGLYGRAAVAASGRPPVAVPQRRLLRYDAVPRDLAAHLYDLFKK